MAGYIRELSSRLLYCDHTCYLDPTIATWMWADIGGLPPPGLPTYRKQT